MPNPSKFLQDCYEVLEPGGVLLLTTPNVLHPYSKIKYVIKASTGCSTKSPTGAPATSHRYLNGCCAST